MHHGLQAARNARVMYVDMNSFFASVEQQHCPAFRGKPLAVVSHQTDSGTVLAASYEAKACGIRTGTKIREAKQLCPSIIFTETSPVLYKDIHLRFMDILRDIFGPEVESRSIDEAAIFLSANWQGTGNAHELAATVKERFRLELGEYIRCSVGIAPNSLLAKLATDMQKPNGLVELTLENLPEKLSKLKLTDFPGIAGQNALRLAMKGIHTPLDLYNKEAEDLRQQFGWWGQQWWWRLHGFEADAAWRPDIKSLSHQHALKHWIHDTDSGREIVDKMTDRLVHRLRTNTLQCKSVTLYFSLLQHHHLEVTRHFDVPTCSYGLLTQSARELLAKLPRQSPAPIRKICVTFNQLSHYSAGVQLDIFGQSARTESVSLAMERVRSRFGFQAIQLGNVIGMDGRVAQQQLGFGRIRDKEPALPSKPQSDIISEDLFGEYEFQ